VENSEAIDTDAWVIVDHACRACGGRVVASADGAKVRCAECSAEAEGSHENLCWCGPAHCCERRVASWRPTTCSERSFWRWVRRQRTVPISRRTRGEFTSGDRALWVGLRWRLQDAVRFRLC
jgi:hypothetical protein